MDNDRVSNISWPRWSSCLETGAQPGRLCMIIVVVAQFSRAALQATINPSSWAFRNSRSMAGSERRKESKSPPPHRCIRAGPQIDSRLIVQLAHRLSWTTLLRDGVVDRLWRRRAGLLSHLRDRRPDLSCISGDADLNMRARTFSVAFAMSSSSSQLEYPPGVQASPSGCRHVPHPGRDAVTGFGETSTRILGERTANGRVPSHYQQIAQRVTQGFAAGDRQQMPLAAVLAISVRSRSDTRADFFKTGAATDASSCTASLRTASFGAESTRTDCG